MQSNNFIQDKIQVNNEVKKICIIAGEPSGDILGSKLIDELKCNFPNAQFCGVGGELMIAKGFSTIFPMEDLTVMGIIEVIPHLSIILKRLKQTAKFIIDTKPEILITIDSPDFCFRVVKKIKKIDAIKKIHLIAPSVWAYRQGRAKKIAKLYDLLLAILPFEPPYFEKYGLKTVFIGHPIIEKKPDFSNADNERKQFRQLNKIGENDFFLALTPGSRNGEVKRIFPEMIDAVNKLYCENPSLKIAIPLVKKTENLVKELSKKINPQHILVNEKNKNSLFFAIDFAIAKSGTNTVELSLYRKPIIVCYKINYLTYWLLKMVIKIKFANLINLILNREAIPELLQRNCNSKKILSILKNYINDKNLEKKQIDEVTLALDALGLNSTLSASKKASIAIFELSKK